MLALAALMESLRVRLGTRLKALREEAHLRAEDVAGAVQCTPDHLWAVERGAVWPGTQLLVALAVVYRVDVADIFTFPGSHPRHTARERLRALPNAAMDEAIEALDQVAAHRTGRAAVPSEAATGPTKAKGRRR